MFTPQRSAGVNEQRDSSTTANLLGALPSGTVAVPVVYIASTDVTGLQQTAHFYRVLVPDLSALQNAIAVVPQAVAEFSSANNNGVGDSSSRQTLQPRKIIEDGSAPILYVVARTAGSVTTNSTFSSPSRIIINTSAAAATTPANFTARELIMETIEFARVQCLVMTAADAQRLLDEAGCVPPRFWTDVNSIISLCASADFPVASAAATSKVGRVFLDSSGGAAIAPRVAVTVSLTRARRVIRIMNDYVVSNESSPISRQLRALTAALWYTLCVSASEDALDFVRPVLSGSAAVRAAHSSRLVHIRRVKKLRESLFTVDTTAGAVFHSELTESRTLTQAATSIKQQLYRSIGRVTDLVGSAMRHDVDWSAVQRPEYGRELRRIHFRPLKTTGAAAAQTVSEHSPSSDEHVFLWSKALTPIQVRLSRQGWERCVQSDPVMWRFKSLPVRLKETTTKLSKLFQCSTGELMICESAQIARATVLRSLPWTPGDAMLLVDGLVPGCYTALASFLKEQNSVVVHTLGVTEPVPTENGGEAFVNALARAIDLTKPLVCIVPHLTRTGHVLPIERIIPVCRTRRVVVIVDGTDVVNNVATQVGLYNADFYIAPLDTHLFCQPGLTAVVVSKTRKEAVSTLTVSYFTGQGFEEEWTYTGLTDQTRMISIIQSLQFNKSVCPDQAQYTRQLATQAHDFLTKFWNVQPIYRTVESAIVSVMLPLAGQRHDADARFLQALLVRRGIFVDVLAVKFAHNNHKLVVRLAFYPYNDMLEVKRLAIAVHEAIKEIS